MVLGRGCTDEYIAGPELGWMGRWEAEGTMKAPAPGEKNFARLKPCRVERAATASGKLGSKIEGDNFAKTYRNCNGADDDGRRRVRTDSHEGQRVCWILAEQCQFGS